MSWVERVVQSLVDFVVEEHCQICGGSVMASAAPGGATGTSRRPDSDPSENVGSIGRDGAPIDILGRGGEISPLGPLRIHNAMLCAGCRRRFIPRYGGRLFGWWTGSRVVTRSGDVSTPRRPSRRDVAGRRRLSVWAPFVMNDAAVAWISRAKFNGCQSLLGPAAAAMAAVLGPVPASRASVRRRGFNPPEQLARGVARELGFAAAPGGLRREREGPAQSKMPRECRAANVYGAFGAGPRRFDGRPVILVDDLVTTGATAAACLAELGGAGARVAGVACFASAL